MSTRRTRRSSIIDTPYSPEPPEADSRSSEEPVTISSTAATAAVAAIRVNNDNLSEDDEGKNDEEEDDDIMEISPTPKPIPPVIQVEDDESEEEKAKEDEEEGRSFIRVRNAADGIFENEDDDDDNEDEDKDNDETGWEVNRLQIIPNLVAPGQSRKRKQDINCINENDDDIIELNDDECFQHEPMMTSDTMKNGKVPLYLLNPDDYQHDPEKQMQIRRAAMTYRHHQGKKIQTGQLMEENKQLRKYMNELKVLLLQTSRCGCPKNKNVDLSILDKVIATSSERAFQKCKSNSNSEAPPPSLQKFSPATSVYDNQKQRNVENNSSRQLANAISSNFQEASRSVFNIANVAASRPSITIAPIRGTAKPTSATPSPFRINVSDFINGGTSFSLPEKPKSPELRASPCPQPPPLVSAPPPPPPAKPAEPPKTASQLLFEARKQQKNQQSASSAPCNLLNHSRKPATSVSQLPPITTTNTNVIPVTAGLVVNGTLETVPPTIKTVHYVSPKPSTLRPVTTNTSKVFPARRGRPPNANKTRTFMGYGSDRTPVPIKPRPNFLIKLAPASSIPLQFSVQPQRLNNTRKQVSNEELKAMWKSLETDEDEMAIIKALQSSTLPSSSTSVSNRPPPPKVAKMQVPNNRPCGIIPKGNSLHNNNNNVNSNAKKIVSSNGTEIQLDKYADLLFEEAD